MVATRMVGAPLAAAVLVFTVWSDPAAAQGKWSQGAPMPTPRSEVVAAALDGLIYVVGGLTSAGGLTAFEAYDPTTNTWSVLPPIPEARHHTAMAALNGRIYVTGGYGRDGFNRVLGTNWMYDPKTGRWSEAPPMPGDRAAHAMVAVGPRLFVAGGVAADPNSVWSFDPAIGKWDTSWAPIPSMREHTSAASLDGKLYVVGGRWSRGNLNVAEVLDPETNTWTPLPSMPSPRGGLTAAVVGGRIHVTGGEELAGGQTYAAHESFDPSTGVWQTLPPLPTARHGLASASLAGVWYVIGGATGAGGLTYTTLSNAVEAFTPAP